MWHSEANSIYTPEFMPPSPETKKNPKWPLSGHFENDIAEIDKLLPIYTTIVLLKFGVDIQSQTKFRVRKTTNPICPQGGHFESEIPESHRLLSSATNDIHMKFESEIPNQTRIMFRKPCPLKSQETNNPIWPAGRHFENDVIENR